MMMPDVTELIDDPEIGGGQPFTVIRKTVTRTRGGVSESQQEYHVTGNVQPAQEISLQQLELEDKSDEVISIHTRFPMQTGSNAGVSFVSADEILYSGSRWRLLRVMPWNQWGFCVGYATRVKE